MDAFDLLVCPVCGQPLAPDHHPMPRQLRCGGRHSFDVARQGYVNLLGRATPANADTTAMVAARERFLSQGHYLPIADAVTDVLTDQPRCLRIVEVGAGTGYYLARALDALDDAIGLATDVSVAAIKRAARAHPRARAMVADTWDGLPVASGAVDAVVCVFAPRNPTEFARLLPGGAVAVVVTPNPDHLAELRDSCGLLGIEPGKLDHLMRSLTPDFEPAGSHRVAFPMILDPAAASDLIAMGPNAFHQRIEITSTVETMVDVQVSCFLRA